jgi:hypothetical protein
VPACLARIAVAFLERNRTRQTDDAARNIPSMNMKRLLLAIIVGFLVVFGTDFLIHGLWLMPDYRATQALWRADAEMQTRYWWMFFAQFLTVATFVVLWAIGFARRGSVALAIGYGLLMGLFQQVWAIIDFVVIPMPGALAAKWFFAGLIQAVILGLVTFVAYKPAATGP